MVWLQVGLWIIYKHTPKPAKVIPCDNDLCPLQPVQFIRIISILWSFCLKKENNFCLLSCYLSLSIANVPVIHFTNHARQTYCLCRDVLWSYGPSVAIQQRAFTTCGNFYSLHSIEARTQSIPLFAFYASGDSFFCFWYLHKPSLLGRMEAKPKVPFINNYRSRCPRMEGVWFKPRMGSEPVVHVHTRSLDGA